MHVPVLLHEVIAMLDPKPGEFVIDGTMGGGGHSAEIAARLMPHGTFLGVDIDKEALRIARPKVKKIMHHAICCYGNYADLPEMLRKRKLPKAQGFLLDLGFSSYQLEDASRGFSFLSDAPLRMTYDREERSVGEILRGMSGYELERIIREYSGERYARRIAQAIVVAEKKEPIATTKELARIIARAVPPYYEKKRIHPATRTFQALRIFVNNELGNLEKALRNIPKVMAPGGRAVIISFHSLEDKLVKHSFREFAKTGILNIITKKPVIVEEEERRKNPRSRSAKLRAARVVSQANP